MGKLGDFLTYFGAYVILFLVFEISLNLISPDFNQ